MGLAERLPENHLTTASDIAAYLLRCCSSLGEFETYMFGSTLRGIGVDVDILVVGHAGDAMSKLKRELQIASECLPLHVLYMQASEAKRTEFITRQNCVPLTKLAAALN